MKLFTIVGLVIVSACLPGATSDEALHTECFRGTINEDDLTDGEILLNEEDLVKVRLSDQKAMSSRSGGRLSFPASQEDIETYSLGDDPEWHWMVAVASGLFGTNIDNAGENFSTNAEVHASYYPSTKKVVVFTNLPSVEGAQAFGFFVFVRVPRETRTITYDCGAFE